MQAQQSIYQPQLQQQQQQQQQQEQPLSQQQLQNLLPLLAAIQQQPTQLQQPQIVLNPQQDKINRELFVGNTPAGTSEILLQYFVNAAMRRCSLCGPYETPIINARVNSKFAFVECTTIDMANRCLNLNGIPFIGGVQLKICRPSKYIGPVVPAVTWYQLTGQDMNTTITTANGTINYDPEMEKLQRELFVGNTTSEMTSQMLQEFLGNAMIQVGLTTAPGNPITACRVSNKFAFIELRSSIEAANALNLNNISYLGTQLRVGRPSKYNGPTEQHLNWEDILAKFLSGELQPSNFNTPTPAIAGSNEQQQVAAVTDAVNTVTTTTTTDGAVSSTTTKSRIVELRNMLSIDDLMNPDEYQDIIDDTREQCTEFGTLQSVIIPRHNEVGATKIFLEYSTIDDATNAIIGLQGRTFDGRFVEATYFDETKFNNKDYS